MQKRQDWIIPKLEKLSYFLGAGSHAAASTFVSTFLTTYLLMIGVDATISAAVLLPDMAEMAKYRTNTERVGIIFSIHSFVQKLVGSLSTSVALLILSAYGFVSVQANSFEELARLNEQGIGLQTPRALEGLWNTAYLFPALGFGLAALIFMLVKIDRRQIAVMIKANLGQASCEEAEAQLHAQQ